MESAKQTKTLVRKLRYRVAPSLNATDHAILAGLASELDVKPSWLVRRAIKEFLTKYTAQATQLRLDFGIK